MTVYSSATDVPIASSQFRNVDVLTDASGTYTVPANVTTIMVEVHAAGGSCRVAALTTVLAAKSQDGAGGGAYAMGFFDVVQGQQFSYANPAPSLASNGSNTKAWFNSDTSLFAYLGESLNDASNNGDVEATGGGTDVAHVVDGQQGGIGGSHITVLATQLVGISGAGGGSGGGYQGGASAGSPVGGGILPATDSPPQRYGGGASGVAGLLSAFEVIRQGATGAILVWY